MDGAVSVHNNNFTIIICNRDKSLQVRFSMDLTKKIDDCQKFGYKTSYVVTEFVPQILGTVSSSYHLDRTVAESNSSESVSDAKKSKAANLVLVFQLQDVSPFQLERLLIHIVDEVSKATMPVVDPIQIESPGIIAQLRRLFSWR